MGRSGFLGFYLLKGATRSGMIPIAVCSPRNFALAKSNGAEEVFDRNDKECVQKIVSLVFFLFYPFFANAP